MANHKCKSKICTHSEHYPVTDIPNAALAVTENEMQRTRAIVRAMIDLTTNRGLTFEPQPGPKFGDVGYTEAYKPVGIPTMYVITMGISEWECIELTLGDNGTFYETGKTYHNHQVDANVKAVRLASEELARANNPELWAE